MNYEEKYKEMKKRVLAIGQGYVKEVDYSSPRSIAEYIDPELRESEDEKIRKGLINMLSQDYELHKEAIAWLEKQGEHNEQNFWEMCNHCEYFDGYDLCLHKMNFGAVTDELKENCRNNKLFIEKQDEQKPWSEEDEDVINHLLAICAGAKKYRQFAGCLQEDITKYQTWLKFLKERVQPQPKQEWSEEDEKMKSLIISTLTSMGTLNLERYHHMNLDEVKNWLESIKDRVQPKQEWNKEDEEKIMWLVRLISTAGYRELDNDKMPCSRSELIDWLKSLKPNHWKPSKEQMKALNAINIFGELSYVGQGGTLVKLYNDLKKL